MSKRIHSRHPPRSTVTASTAAGKLQRHLRRLGIESLEAYQEWCRKNGLRPGLVKDWVERAAEQHLQEQLLAGAAQAEDVEKHLKALGLSTPDEYIGWCRRHGFAAGLHKSREVRRQEVQAAEREKAAGILAGARRHHRRPEEFIKSLIRGERPATAGTSPSLALIAACFEEAEGPVRDAFLDLLLHVHRTAGAKRSGLLEAAPAVAHLGPQPGNSGIEALLAIARRKQHWVRPLETWRPADYAARRQFASLARHLLSRYPVPAFMDAAWFEGQTPEALRRQTWFMHIGAGQNIRTADIPVALSKRAAHHFLQAPADSTIEAAFRWGQVHALGGDEYLARAINLSRLREFQEDEPFWGTVLQFFVNNPMLERSRIGPMIDFIHHRRFAPPDHPAADGGHAGPGEAKDEGPPDPGFSMKGRTAQALWRLVETWHRQLAREAKKPPVQWNPCGIGEFELREHDEESGGEVCWRIREILTHHDLVEEGRAMSHCVASYGAACASGRSAVFSIQLESPASGIYRRVMTVEVQPRRRMIVQARGRCNGTPQERRSGGRLKRTPFVLRQWAVQEGLSIPKHL